MRKALRWVVKSLSSAKLATLLLAFVGLWAMLASLVPQGTAADSRLSGWAAAHPAAESVARAIGLHRAFSAPLFAAVVLVLALSTALCAWQRTKVAVGRGRLLRKAATLDHVALEARHDFEVPYDLALGEPEVLSIAADTLRELGISTKSDGGVIRAISPAWSTWGSPVFHWALLALMVTMLVGNLVRASGQMGLLVGQTRADEAAAYGFLSEGPLHSWKGVQRAIRLDGFDVNYRTGGVDRGPSPTVSVLDAAGQVIKSQRVYPNKTLKTGALTIYPYDYGLAATVSLADANGTEVGRTAQLVDFSSEATGGTAPAGYLSVGDAGGNPALKVFISVPLDSAGGGFAARLPETPRARVVVTSLDDTPVLDRVLLPGAGLELPVGGTLRLLDVGYYARLQLVDDPSIPVLYAGLVIALVGLTVGTLSRQQAVSAAVVHGEDGSVLAVRMRLWRNVTSTRDEIERELASALGGNREGDTA